MKEIFYKDILEIVTKLRIDIVTQTSSVLIYLSLNEGLGEWELKPYFVFFYLMEIIKPWSSPLSHTNKN